MKPIWNNKNNILSEPVQRFVVGNDYRMDQILFPYDLEGSLAHAEMLCKIGILTQTEFKKSEGVLKILAKEYRDGKIELRFEDEDMHSYIERRLVADLGPIGKKIHTGRSRNDQVLTALRLFARDQLLQVIQKVSGVGGVFKTFSRNYGDIQIAGYTHMRKAMPITLKMWAEAFVESMEDNEKLLRWIQKHVDQNPLGSGAGFGVPLNLDREWTTKKLKFEKLQLNPIYVQNSRAKFEALILDALSQVMWDLNKLASDLMLLSMPEFGVFEIPEAFCTGSSMMPQKKNPDCLEILRSKYHVLLGEAFKIKNISSNLISGFHRDVQLTKEAFLNGVSLVQECLEVALLLIPALTVNRKKAKALLTKDLFATEAAYQLVAQGTPFRDAYFQVKEKLL